MTVLFIYLIIYGTLIQGCRNKQGALKSSQRYLNKTNLNTDIKNPKTWITDGISNS